jgi:beta-glucanase (GH16 family)
MITADDLKALHRLVDAWAGPLMTAAASPAPAPPAPATPNSGMRLTFEHVFDYEGEPDWNIWDSQFWYSDPAGLGCSLVDNGELEWYVNHRNRLGGLAPWSVSKEGLVLRASPLPAALIPQAGYDQPTVRNRGSYRYSSGMLQNKRSFSQMYGYFEVECRVPAGRGLWPAFWLLPTSGKWPPEIDVMEVLGHEPNRLYFTQHWQEAGVHKSDSIQSWADFTQWHRLGCLWDKSGLRFYLDGVLAADGGRLPCMVDEPMYMLLDLAVGGGWPGSPDATTHFPADFCVRSVRAWAP